MQRYNSFFLKYYCDKGEINNDLYGKLRFPRLYFLVVILIFSSFLNGCATYRDSRFGHSFGQTAIPDPSKDFPIFKIEGNVISFPFDVEKKGQPPVILVVNPENQRVETIVREGLDRAPLKYPETPAGGIDVDQTTVIHGGSGCLINNGWPSLCW